MAFLVIGGIFGFILTITVDVKTVSIFLYVYRLWLRLWSFMYGSSSPPYFTIEEEPVQEKFTFRSFFRCFFWLLFIYLGISILLLELLAILGVSVISSFLSLPTQTIAVIMVGVCILSSPFMFPIFVIEKLSIRYKKRMLIKEYFLPTLRNVLLTANSILTLASILLLEGGRFLPPALVLLLFCVYPIEAGYAIMFKVLEGRAVSKAYERISQALAKA